MKVPRKEQNYLPPELHVLPEPEQTEEEKWLESLETVLEFALKDKGLQKTARFYSGPSIWEFSAPSMTETTGLHRTRV